MVFVGLTQPHTTHLINRSCSQVVVKKPRFYVRGVRLKDKIESKLNLKYILIDINNKINKRL